MDKIKVLMAIIIATILLTVNSIAQDVIIEGNVQTQTPMWLELAILISIGLGVTYRTWEGWYEKKKEEPDLKFDIYFLRTGFVSIFVVFLAFMSNPPVVLSEVSLLILTATAFISGYGANEVVNTKLKR
jgi:hypothetical protein